MDYLSDEYYILAYRAKFYINPNTTEKELEQAAEIINQIKNNSYVKSYEYVPPKNPSSPPTMNSNGGVTIDFRELNPDNTATMTPTYYKYEDFLAEAAAWRNSRSN